MKALYTSDWHLDNTSTGWPRFQDTLDAIDKMVEVANEEKVDWFIFGGDLLDGHKPNAMAWTYLSKIKKSLYELHEDTGVILVPGNHDVIDRPGHRSVLSALIDVEWIVAEEPSLIDLRHGVSLIALPHLSPVHCQFETCEQWIEEVVGPWLREDIGPKEKIIVVSHLELKEVQYGSEQDMPRGTRAPVLPQWLIDDPRVAIILSGHYHTPQTIGKIHIVGSPVRHSFDEADDQKGFLIVEV